MQFDALFVFELDNYAVNPVIFDGRVRLDSREPDPSFTMQSVADGTPVSSEDAAWIASVVAWHHEIPTLAVPVADDSPRPGWYMETTDFQGEPVSSHYDYAGQARDVLEYASLLHGGPSFRPVYCWDDFNELPDAARSIDAGVEVFTAHLRQAEPLLHLYASALRQADPSSAYLFFYRIFEKKGGTNGKSWVKEACKSMEGIEMGSVRASKQFGAAPMPDLMPRVSKDRLVIQLSPTREALEYTELLRARAIACLEDFSRTKPGSPIEDILYTLRNSIAHGGRLPVLHSGINPDIAQVFTYLPLVRALARAAIGSTIASGIEPSA